MGHGTANTSLLSLFQIPACLRAGRCCHSIGYILSDEALVARDFRTKAVRAVPRCAHHLLT